MKNAGEKVNADFILIDIGPNLGAINRAALISADYVVVPVTYFLCKACQTLAKH